MSAIFVVRALALLFLLLVVHALFGRVVPGLRRHTSLLLYPLLLLLSYLRTRGSRRGGGARATYARKHDVAASRSITSVIVIITVVGASRVRGLWRTADRGCC